MRVLSQARIRFLFFVIVVSGAVLVVSAAIAAAGCPATDILGQWRQAETGNRWYFFGNNEVDCRTCSGWDDNAGCHYVPDAKDALNRQKCTWKGAGGDLVTVTGWRAEGGRLSALVFSDGSARAVGEACRIDGEEGTMTIPGIGRLECFYNYQCQRLGR